MKRSIPIQMLGAKTVVFTEKAVCTGEIELYDLCAADGDKLSLLAAAAAMEQGDTHTFGAALLSAAAQLALPLPAAEDVLYTRGKGVSARIGEDVYFLGNKKALREIGAPIPYAVQHTDFCGYSVLYAAKNGAFHGFFLFRKVAYPTIVPIVRSLNTLGKRTVLLGKDRGTVLLGKRLGMCETKTVLLQREREKVLQELQKRDRIFLIDGMPEKALGAWFAAAAQITHPARRHFSPYTRLALEEEAMFGKVNYTMKIEGMNCAHCSARVKTALESLRGVSAKISLEEKLARVKCPASMEAQKLSDAVTEVGFAVVSVERV